MSSVGVHEAKTNLSKLLRRVSAGEEITIMRSGKPVAKLIPLTPVGQRELGLDEGLYRVPDDFDEPLPGDLLAAFEG